MKWYNLRRDMSRKDAKLILKYMQDILDGYSLVTLADFYDLVDSGFVRYSDNKKIWRSLAGARVSLCRKHGRYRIKLPDFVEMK